MSAAQELLDIAAEYVASRESVTWAEAYGVDPVVDPGEIASRWEQALEAYVAGQR